MITTKLLSVSQDSKTIKGEKKGFLTGVMYLAPADESGVINTCPFATAGCRNACLYKSGRAALVRNDGSNPIIEARIRRTKFYAEDRNGFFIQLISEIEKLIKKAEKKGLTPVVRLNGTSDIAWESIKTPFGVSIIDLFPNIQFYDYTAIPARAIRFAKGTFPKNYHLTFSRKETSDNHKVVEQLAALGGNVSVVFSKKEQPKEFLGLPVIAGDETDLRFLDPKGSVIGLYAKGKDAKNDKTGFVIHLD